jgi:hypothetical protein
MPRIACERFAVAVPASYKMPHAGRATRAVGWPYDWGCRSPCQTPTSSRIGQGAGERAPGATARRCPGEAAHHRGRAGAAPGARLHRHRRRSSTRRVYVADWRHFDVWRLHSSSSGAWKAACQRAPALLGGARPSGAGTAIVPANITLLLGASEPDCQRRDVAHRHQQGDCDEEEGPQRLRRLRHRAAGDRR